MTKHKSKLKRPQPGDEDYREPAGVQPQPRDIKILDLVYKHRLLSSRQIYALVEGSEHRLKERLRLLWLNRYLERPPDQKVLRIRGVLRHLVYSLGPKGAKILAAEKGYNTRQLDWVARSEVKFPFIIHNLFVSEIFTCLKLALRNRGEIELTDWCQGKEIESRINRPPKMDARESRSDHPLLQPDGFFVLHLPDNQKQYFYLEADRGTVREKTMLGRYKKYWGFWKQNKYPKHGIPVEGGFRVLTVCKNPTRARNLRQLIEENDPWKSEEDMTTMFWFAHKQWSIDNPESILRKCWKTPKDAFKRSLID